MTWKVSARLSRWSLLFVSLGFAANAVAGEANLLASSSDPRYRAVGQLAWDIASDTETATATCTASVVAGSATPDPGQPALVLTSGHCVLGQEAVPNQVMVDGDVSANLRFTPAFFQDAQTVHVTVPVARVLYATTKGMDAAVLRLDVTYGDLQALGIVPLVPASPAIAGSLPIELAHVPVRDVAASEQFLRLSTCTTREPTRLFEGERFFLHESGTDCAGVSGGSSGAPVLRRGTSELVGILGTMVDPRFDGCGFDRPCELTGRQSHSRAGTSYHSLVGPLHGAFRIDGTWDPKGLDRGDGVRLERTVGQYTRSQVTEEGEPEPARWGVIVADDTRWIRHKQGDAATIDCADIRGYSEPVIARELPMNRLPVPAEEGVYAMCVIGQMGIDNDWQSPEHASVMLRVIDDTPPTTVPGFEIVEETDAAWVVRIDSPYVSPPIVKVGRLATTDCADAARYRTLDTTVFSLPKAKAPLRVCAKGSDEAGNLSFPGVKDLGDFHSP
jgi:hypothetical protein